MSLKRISILIFLCLVLVVSLTACKSSKSLAFQIDNGEKIKVTLNTTDGYDLQQKDGTVTVKKDDKDILMGFFLNEEGYDDYVASINSTKDVTIIEAVPESAPTFYLYQFDGEAGTETTFLFKIDGAKTGIIFTSLSAMEEAKSAYELLTFEKTE